MCFPKSPIELPALFHPVTPNGRGAIVLVGATPVSVKPRRPRPKHQARPGGIAHPPTARLRQCGAWGRR